VDANIVIVLGVKAL